MRSGLVVASVTAGGRFINIWSSELDFLTRSTSNNWVGGGQGGPSNGEGGDQSDTYWVGAELLMISSVGLRKYLVLVQELFVSNICG